jgi:cysteine synthase
MRKKIIIRPAPVSKNSCVEQFCNKRNIIILDCSKIRTGEGFSSGTFKDYRSAQLVNDFGDKNPVLYSIAYTNAGYSLGMIAREYNTLNKLDENTGVKVICLIDEKTDLQVKKILERCSEIIELPLSEKIFSREEIRNIVHNRVNENESEMIKETERIKEREIIDAENHPHSYSQLAEQILKNKPDVVFMPLGGGEAVYSLLTLLDKQNRVGEKTPKVIAATIRANVYAGNNNVRYSFADKLVTPFSELQPEISIMIHRFGEIVVVEEEEILCAYHMLQKSGIKAEPSAAVVFAAAKKKEMKQNEKILLVNSGCGIYFDENNELQLPDSGLTG